MRAAIALLTLLTLGGCNMVGSDTPLFSGVDTQGALSPRPGLWVASDPKCRVKESRPVQLWPKCAVWAYVRSGEVLMYAKDQKPPAWSRTVFLVAAGDPSVVQFAFPPDDQGATSFVYEGVTPRLQDPDGRVLQYRHWTANCHPPEWTSPNGPERLPGVDKDCKAHDPEAVRASVKVSEKWATQDQTWRWVRDALP